LREAILQYKRYPFEYLALQVFYFQANYNAVYRNYISHLGINPSKITQLEQIPYLPIGFFKTQSVDSFQGNSHSLVFESSGTTGTNNSKHRLYDQELYKIISEKTFEAEYGRLQDYHILALLPSYLERNNSSLVYMVKHFIEQSNSPFSGFYLHDTDQLRHQLTLCMQDNTRKTLLLGVTFALLDLAESDVSFLRDRSYHESLIVMETGGMKGKRKEMIREEVHQILTAAFGVESIHSEYGMTELISQGYSFGKGIFRPGPTMKITLRDINDPLTGFFDYISYKGTGGINVIDLGNLDSCSFIETQDLGRFTPTKDEFEVIGRFDNSDIRGCNLMVL
jgi:phenylacetate-coenzyme A ligase PaaK-like adenylate-forming protein